MASGNAVAVVAKSLELSDNDIWEMDIQGDADSNAAAAFELGTWNGNSSWKGEMRAISKSSSVNSLLNA